MPYSPGLRVGPYEIVSKLGSGGMGEVYLSRDLKLGRDVAIKVLRPDLAQEPEELGRFEQEARSASALNHPNIVTIYDIGRYESAPYIAMEYVEGSTLRELLSAGPIPMRRLLSFAIQIADGLAKAHSAGILHRDLKPQNIMVTPEGFVKIVDFGLAKLIPRTLEPTESVTPAEFSTRPGVVLGTVAYMSPEQARGPAADFRSDQFSFGSILYEMATGKHPFRRETQVETLVAIIEHDAEPMANLNPKVPPQFCWIVERCLAKAPEERYASSFDLAKELQRLRDHLGDASGPRPTGDRSRSAARWIMASMVALVAALAFVFGFDVAGVRTRLLGVPPPATIDSIAVVRLENLSRDPEQDYFADGMTDELIAALAKVEGVKVISLKAVMPVRGLAKPFQEIAKELDVDSLLRGSVMKEGDRVRITTELVEASDGRLLWAESYAGSLRDMLTFQNDVAQAISREIRAKVTPLQRDRLNARHSVDPEAYEAYLRGRYHWNKRTPAGLKRALEYFEQAVGKDAGYASAHAGIADSYVLMGNYDVAVREQDRGRAREAAFAAVQMDPLLAEASTSMAAVSETFDWDWIAAERAYERAIELNPSYATAHHWYALLLSMQSRHDDAIAEIQRARELEPLSLIINSNVGWVLYLARRYEEAIQHYEKTLELDDTFAVTHYYLGLAYEQVGRFEPAIQELETAVALSENSPYALSGLGHVYARSGRRQDAEKVFSDLERQAQTDYVPSIYLAWIQVGLASKARALEFLEKAYGEHNQELPYLKVEPAWDPLRSEPQFNDLLKRLGLEN